MKNVVVFLGFLLFLCTAEVLPSRSPISLDFETGLARSGYNDIAVPGDTGTMLSLSRELSADNTTFFRLRLNYQLTEKKVISFLAAPLSIRSQGRLTKNVHFSGVDFPINTTLSTNFTFNSYRVTYRYTLFQGESLRFGCGITAKIRDATIHFKSENLESEKSNTGVVPLINFDLDYALTDRMRLRCIGDALAAPQGRAEDILFAMFYDVSDALTVKSGYRLLEGGADNDEVYSFSLIHYYTIGAILRF